MTKWVLCSWKSSILMQLFCPWSWLKVHSSLQLSPPRQWTRNLAAELFGVDIFIPDNANMSFAFGVLYMMIYYCGIGLKLFLNHNMLCFIVCFNFKALELFIICTCAMHCLNMFVRRFTVNMMHLCRFLHVILMENTMLYHVQLVLFTLQLINSSI